jgi:putative membrane protein
MVSSPRAFSHLDLRYWSPRTLEAVMTAVAPAPAPATHQRRGWHIPTWAAITAGVVLLVVAALGVLRAVRLHRRDRFDRGFGRMGDHMGSGHVHWVLWLVVILALVGGIALLVAATRSRRAAVAAVAAPAVVTPAVGAEQILAERFARGEIDEAEFVARRDALRG